MKNKNYIIQLKPVFNKKIIFFRMIPLQIFASLWLGIFSKVVKGFIIKSLGIQLYNFEIYVGLITFVLFPLIYIYYINKVYLKTVFFIYEDRIEYQEGFFNIDSKTILFKNITEVNLKINVLQNKVNLGNILLSIPSFNRKGKFSGLIIKDIENPKLVYEKISNLIS